MAAQVGAPGAAVRAHEELFAYWASLRDGARLPGRASLDPAPIKRLLPTVSLIDVVSEPQGTAEFPFHGIRLVCREGL